ncbi:MAG TPA: adenosylcobalamin-dependent ribonucleoside-diphosphate reductase [Candidatus Obscuribacterales bacterium]
MFSENALKVLEKRYFLRNEDGRIVEDVQAIFRRVAKAIASVERRWGASEDEIARLENQFFDSLINRRFMPNSPTLMNAGKPQGQLSACFVLPVPDSLEGIFETCKNAALIHKTGGGTGFSFSRLRPQNDRVATTTGVASGPVSFMIVYDAATEAIRQGGTRRGANMGMLRVDHPDIEEFIACKRDTGKLNNFNISVAATDAFMNAVVTDDQYDLIHPRTGTKVRALRARDIFDKIVENAHATGEPGLIFIDRINKSDPIELALDDNGNAIPGTEDIEATNPCGEQPLGPGDACNLGSINVALFVDRKKKDFEWTALADEIELAVRFLDDVIDANHYPLPFIERATLNNRRIGLGIMGWAEALIQLGTAYDSEEAVAKAEEFMRFMQETAHRASAELAESRGTFPNWPFSTWHKKGVRMRNATVTTIAPTGTISIIAGTSSGIEPVFAIAYVRRVLSGTELIEVNPLFEQMAKEEGFYSDELMQRIAEEGTLKSIEGIPARIKRLFVCSHDISCFWHVRMQAAFQKYTDNAVSKTINFPHDADVDDIRQAYLEAWKEGLKGITVYRDASRPLQVLNLRKTQKKEESPLKKESSAGRAGTSMSPQNSSIPSVRSVKLSPASVSTEYPSENMSISTYSTTHWHEHIFKKQEAHRLDMISMSSCPECGYAPGSVAHQESCFLCVTCGYTMC